MLFINIIIISHYGYFFIYYSHYYFHIINKHYGIHIIIFLLIYLIYNVKP